MPIPRAIDRRENCCGVSVATVGKIRRGGVKRETRTAVCALQASAELKKLKEL